MIKVTTSEIVDAYAHFHSVPKVAKALGISATTVARRLATAGVRLDGRERYLTAARAFSPGTDEEIGRRYLAGELSADLARDFGVTIYAIKQSVTRSGVGLRPNPTPLATEEQVNRIVDLHKGGMSYARISVTIGRSPKFVSAALRRRGIVAKRATGPSHGSWRGGRQLASGYWRVKLDPLDPFYGMANAAGYVMEHRIILARMLGRAIRQSETVHHINGDRKDNRPENLQLRHGRHGKGVALCCAECGSRNLVPVEIN